MPPNVRQSLSPLLKLIHPDIMLSSKAPFHVTRQNEKALQHLNEWIDIVQAGASGKEVHNAMELTSSLVFFIPKKEEISDKEKVFLPYHFTIRIPSHLLLPLPAVPEKWQTYVNSHVQKLMKMGSFFPQYENVQVYKTIEKPRKVLSILKRNRAIKQDRNEKTQRQAITALLQTDETLLVSSKDDMDFDMESIENLLTCQMEYATELEIWECNYFASQLFLFFSRNGMELELYSLQWKRIWMVIERREEEEEYLSLEEISKDNDDVLKDDDNALTSSSFVLSFNVRWFAEYSEAERIEQFHHLFPKKEKNKSDDKEEHNDNKHNDDE